MRTGTYFWPATHAPMMLDYFCVMCRRSTSEAMAAHDAPFRPGVEGHVAGISRGHTDRHESFAASDPPVGWALADEMGRNRSAMRDASYPSSQRTKLPAATPRYPAISQIESAAAPDSTLNYLRENLDRAKGFEL
jgi:hypothetical protein